MRTKTLLLSAAVIAAGLSYASAQVYSVNVVGYVNVSLPANSFYLAANPLDNAGTNNLNGLFGALPSKSTAQTWNGSGFDPSTKGASGWSPNLAVPVGTGVFVKSVSAITNTFVGQTIVGPGQSVTNAVGTSFVMVGSMLPYAGDNNNTNINLLALPAKSTMQTWNGSGYSPSTRGASAWSPALTLDVAQGFFVKGNSAANWVQTMPQ